VKFRHQASPFSYLINGANADGFLKEPGISGALVGGASLKKEEFLGIIRAADKYN